VEPSDEEGGDEPQVDSKVDEKEELVPESDDERSPDTSPARQSDSPEASPTRPSESVAASPARPSSDGAPSSSRESSPARPKSKPKKKAAVYSEDSDRASDCSFKMSDSDADDFVASDDESEFELPVSKKKAAAKKKKAAPAAAKKKKAAKKGAITKSPARRATAKASPARMAMKPAAPKRKLNTIKKATGKLPGLKPRSRMMQIPAAGSTSRGPSISKLGSGGPRFRSGLSRKEKIPRLHKYLKDE